MSEMVERVARALWAANGHEGDGSVWSQDFDEMPENGRVSYRRIAWQAIAAMHGPTGAMVTAGHEASKDAMGNVSQSFGFTPYLIPDCWNAMIDEALK